MNDRIAKRKLDELGRVIIPIDFRKKIGLKPYDSVDVYIKGNFILIEKSEQS